MALLTHQSNNNQHQPAGPGSRSRLNAIMDTEENAEENIPSALIVLRMPREKKGRYVLASRNENKKLYEWIIERLDAASEEAAAKIEARKSP